MSLGSPRYDGQLYYREGIRCAGATDAISCAKRRIISLRNTIVRTGQKQNVHGLPQLTMVLPQICETRRAVRELVNGMFAKCKWREQLTEVTKCERLGCEKQSSIGTQFCQEHAMMAVGLSVSASHVRNVVRENLNRNTNCDLLTPDDARRWFEDPLTTFGVLSEDEIECLDRIRDSNNFYATDTEAVGQLLVQAAVVDSNQRVVFSGHIHHDCATVQELWQLVIDVNGGRLTSVESIGLRRAFGSPSTQPPQGYSVAWLNEQWRLLKEKAPDLQIAEWSRHPHDRVLYQRNLSRAGYNPDDVLPEITSWVSPMQWLQYSSPSLPGYQLGYVCAIYAPSSLVFRWHDALVDPHMLMDIMSTRQKKVSSRQGDNSKSCRSHFAPF